MSIIAVSPLPAKRPRIVRTVRVRAATPNAPPPSMTTAVSPKQKQTAKAAKESGGNGWQKLAKARADAFWHVFHSMIPAAQKAAAKGIFEKHEANKMPPAGPQQWPTLAKRRADAFWELWHSTVPKAHKATAKEAFQILGGATPAGKWEAGFTPGTPPKPGSPPKAGGGGGGGGGGGNGWQMLAKARADAFWHVFHKLVPADKKGAAKAVFEKHQAHKMPPPGPQQWPTLAKRRADAFWEQFHKLVPADKKGAAKQAFDAAGGATPAAKWAQGFKPAGLSGYDDAAWIYANPAAVSAASSFTAGGGGNDGGNGNMNGYSPFDSGFGAYECRRDRFGHCMPDAGSDYATTSLPRAEASDPTGNPSGIWTGDTNPPRGTWQGDQTASRNALAADEFAPRGPRGRWQSDPHAPSSPRGSWQRDAGGPPTWGTSVTSFNAAAASAPGFTTMAGDLSGFSLKKFLKNNKETMGKLAPIAGVAATFIPGVGLVAGPAVAAGMKAMSMEGQRMAQAEAMKRAKAAGAPPERWTDYLPGVLKDAGVIGADGQLALPTEQKPISEMFGDVQQLLAAFGIGGKDGGPAPIGPPAQLPPPQPIQPRGTPLGPPAMQDGGLDWKEALPLAAAGVGLLFFGSQLLKK